MPRNTEEEEQTQTSSATNVLLFLLVALIIAIVVYFVWTSTKVESPVRVQNRPRKTSSSHKQAAQAFQQIQKTFISASKSKVMSVRDKARAQTAFRKAIKDSAHRGVGWDTLQQIVLQAYKKAGKEAPERFLNDMRRKHSAPAFSVQL